MFKNIEMAVLFCIFVYFVLFQNSLPLPISSTQNKNGAHIIADFFSNNLIQCKLNIISLETSTQKPDSFQDLLFANLMLAESGGISNLKLRQSTTNETEVLRTHRPISFISSHCSASVILLLSNNFTQDLESSLTETLTKPLLSPFTVKNEDKYIFITKGMDPIDSLKDSPLFNKLKYKVVLSISMEDEVKGHTFCPHCPYVGGMKSFTIPFKSESGESKIIMEKYFPDYQKNYYGALHKVVASQKISSLMVIEKNETTGKYFTRRGSHADMLFHFIDKLNFTYEILPSEKGSTGLQLKNGTWIGAVGDLISGKADWAHLLAVDYNRNQFVESCSGVSTENWGFIVGPPLPVYTWKAIFWPFTFAMWLCIVSASFLCILFGHFFIRYGYTELPKDYVLTGRKLKIGNYATVAQFIAKTLIGQSGDMDASISQPTKIFYGFWLLFALVGTTAYTSKLMTFMTFPVVEQVPETYLELVNSDYEITLQYFGSVIDSVLKTSKDPTFLKVIGRMQKEVDQLKCILKTKKKNVCLIYEVMFNDLKYKNISNRLGQTPIKMPQTAYGFSFEVGVAHEKKAALSPNFKWIIHRAQEMGLVAQWKVNHFAHLLKGKNEYERQTGVSQEFSVENVASDRLQLAHLLGAFVILFFGSFAAVFIFVFEIFKKLCSRKKNSKQSLSWTIMNEAGGIKNQPNLFISEMVSIETSSHFVVLKND